MTRALPLLALYVEDVPMRPRLNITTANVAGALDALRGSGRVALRHGALSYSVRERCPDSGRERVLHVGDFREVAEEA